MSEHDTATEDAAHSDEETPDAPDKTEAPLNREQRRAQAKGKQGASTISPAATNAQHMRGPGTGGAVPGAMSRFQRKTGGK
mgnify:CR=1 FL=1